MLLCALLVDSHLQVRYSFPSLRTSRRAAMKPVNVGSAAGCTGKALCLTGTTEIPENGLRPIRSSPRGGRGPGEERSFGGGSRVSRYALDGHQRWASIEGHISNSARHRSRGSCRRREEEEEALVRHVSWSASVANARCHAQPCRHHAG